jgi:hypothetical protein
MKQTFIILCVLLSLVSCSNNENKNIKNSVLDVSIGDNRAECKEKLDKQGYRWEEKDMLLPNITIKEPVMIDSIGFDNVDYMFFDAKVVMISLDNKYYSQKEAQDAFSKIDKVISDKYLQFKTERKVDMCLNFSEYDDGITNLTVMLIYHPEEEVPLLLQDAETLEMAKESWNLNVMYSATQKKTEKK